MKDLGKLSGFAWGLGYIGGVAALFLLWQFFEQGFEGDLIARYKLAFPFTAAFFLLFSLPAFIFIKEQAKRSVSIRKAFSKGIKDTLNTIKNVRKHKRIAYFLLITILAWILVITFISATTNLTVFYIAAFLTAIVVGSSQAIMRSWYARIIPKAQCSKFFGFNGFASKIAATIGPINFGTVSAMTNQRYAVLTLLPFFIISGYFFLKVRER